MRASERGGHAEADVARPCRPTRSRCSPLSRRARAPLRRAADSVVAGAVAGPGARGQRVYGGVEHRGVVRDGVRGGVAGAQQR